MSSHYVLIILLFLVTQAHSPLVSTKILIKFLPNQILLGLITKRKRKVVFHKFLKICNKNVAIHDKSINVYTISVLFLH